MITLLKSMTAKSEAAARGGETEKVKGSVEGVLLSHTLKGGEVLGSHLPFPI